jgi:hypothetical protein
MEAVSSSQMLAPSCQATQQNIQEVYNMDVAVVMVNIPSHDINYDSTNMTQNVKFEILILMA